MKKNKVKENPIMMKDVDNKKLKKNNIGLSNDEDENAIRSFVIIVIVIAVLAGVIYFLTNKFVAKNDEYVDTVTPGSINYDIVSVGTMFNRPYDDYYVLVYNVEDTAAVKYSAIMSKYKENSEKDGYKQIYICDLNSSLNSKYYNVNNDHKSNPKATGINDLNFGDLTLLEIKNSKIVKYVEKYDTIKEMLSND